MKDEKMEMVLRGAKRIIAERGWRQGGMHGPNGEVCVIGALDVVWLNSKDKIDTVYSCIALMRKMIGCKNLGDWNDSKERTLKHINDALDNAILAVT